MDDDANGHEHVERATEDRRHSGGRVTERDYFERILQERRRSHDAEHAAHDEQHKAQDEALGFARRTLEAAVTDAKGSVEERHDETTRRLDTLESGGAPFASRLDDSLVRLKADVDELKVQAVRTTALDTLRQQSAEKIEQQRKQIKYILIAAGLSLFVSLIVFGVQILGRAQ